MDDQMNGPIKPSSGISKLTRRSVQCVGPWFISLWEGQPVGNIDLCLQDDSGSEDEFTTEFDVDDVTFLRSLDPKEWKDQDHYAVLGLSKLRHRATEEDIKKAHRMKVLKHHPDKRRALGEEIRPDDDYFTCITKAMEILGNPRSRRSYDSVDPCFDDSIPSANDNSKQNFYDVFASIFDANSRWSDKMPVPKLGGPDASREEVERFYAFWYNFESWREYSYYDEEEEKGQARAREERKWIEKQNKAARAKRKKEEMARIRSLVDTAYLLDPRITKFKQDEKERKLAAKQARKEAARARFEAEERRAQAADEEARRIKAEQEAEEKAKQDALKAERDAHKKALKLQRSALRKIVKANDYYATDGEMVHHMASLEKICESFQIEEICDLTNKLSSEGRDAFIAAIKEVESRIEKEIRALMDVMKRSSGSSDQGRSKGGNAPWTPEQLQLLIKAVNVFPAGTNQSWEVVANFINQHHSRNAVTRTAKEVISKAYICLFICMVTKAVHLEVVSDMTTDTFLAAFKRFISRRGRCNQLFCDNGTNFVGANNKLKENLTKLKKKLPNEFSYQLLEMGIDWHFIPPRSPHFGGLWEAGIKSSKYHLKRILKNLTLTYEEFSTILAQVEAFLNSRPLSVISDHPGDDLPLTPAHFLVGESLLLPFEENLEESSISNLRRWRLTQKLVQHFWRRWSKEYLASLNAAYKWHKTQLEPQIDDIVILREENLPPAKWLMGRILKKHPGKDNISRVFSVKTKDGIFVRSYNRLCFLPKPVDG